MLHELNHSVIDAPFTSLSGAMCTKQRYNADVVPTLRDHVPAGAPAGNAMELSSKVFYCDS